MCDTHTHTLRIDPIFAQLTQRGICKYPPIKYSELHSYVNSTADHYQGSHSWRLISFRELKFPFRVSSRDMKFHSEKILKFLSLKNRHNLASAHFSFFSHATMKHEICTFFSLDIFFHEFCRQSAELSTHFHRSLFYML